MTQFLVSDEKPEGYRLEDIFAIVRKDMIRRCTKILDDDKPEARLVLDNNIRILGLLSDCISLAEDSTRTLDKSFGRHKEGEPRIGTK